MSINGNRLSKIEQTQIMVLANCLLHEGFAYQYPTFNEAIEELNRFIDTMKGMGIDERYYSVLDDNTILFINSSKIYFQSFGGDKI